MRICLAWEPEWLFPGSNKDDYLFRVFEVWEKLHKY